MEFVNQTKLEAGWTLGFEPDGRELLVVVVKGTFVIPENDQEAELAEQQIPLTEADEFTGEPGFSATLYETDYAHRKPMCDVLLNGSAYAPGGRPAKRVTVSLQVGSMKKSFNVVGDRVWKRKLFWVRPSSPKPFIQKWISYDCAFGGTDLQSKKPENVKTYLKNPIGIGYYPLTTRKDLIGKPLPNTEEIGKSIKRRTGNFQPMSFGPIGRNFEARFPLAGTYDQEWLENKVPHWPIDFNYRYFQSSPEEQTIKYIVGKEEVLLENLNASGIVKFHLPTLPLQAWAVPYQGRDSVREMVIDTLLIEPDYGRFMMTWRITIPLNKDCFELKRVIVGQIMPALKAEKRAEMAGKKYYPSLGELVREKSQTR